MYQGKHITVIIPARGGSKRLPRKNLLPLRGTPLIVWSIATAQACPEVDQVIVSTDDPEIAEVAQKHGATVLNRPEALGSDTASTIDVLKDVLHQMAATTDVVLLLQPTSPFRKPEWLSEAVAKLTEQQVDMAVTVSRAKFGPEWQLHIEQGFPSNAAGQRL